MRNFQGTFETRKRSFISAFSICMITLMIKYEIFVNEHLPVQTQQNKQRIFNFFKLINKDITAMLLT